MNYNFLLCSCWLVGIWHSLLRVKNWNSSIQLQQERRGQENCWCQEEGDVGRAYSSWQELRTRLCWYCDEDPGSWPRPETRHLRQDQTSSLVLSSWLLQDLLEADQTSHQTPAPDQNLWSWWKQQCWHRQWSRDWLLRVCDWRSLQGLLNQVYHPSNIINTVILIQII